MGIERRIYLTSDRRFDEVINIPTLEIEYLKAEIDFSKYSALIFTSKNSVKALELISSKWRDIISYCVGEETYKEALFFSKNAQKSHFSNDGAEFAKKLANTIRGEKALYLRAKESAHDLKKIFEDYKVLIDEVLVYKSRCKSLDISIKESSIVIFTSPKSYRCFKKLYGMDKNMVAIAIGDSTKNAICEDIEIHTSQKRSIESCVKKAKEIRESYKIKD